MTSPLWDIFGFRENQDAHEEVLEGHFRAPECCDEATKLLLKGLAKSRQTRESMKEKPRTHISTEDHIRGWRRQKEQMSGGISGLHFGHFKAHIKDHKLAALDASLRSVAYTTGYSFWRWKKGLDVQLLKKSNNHNAMNLRTILLLEPDFNMNNKVIGNDAMKRGEELSVHA
jgi:hypothetical protein